MAEATNALTLQFLDWVAGGRHSHADLMETWRSSCPRLSIWEDALLAGFVRYDGERRVIELTSAGRAAISANDDGRQPDSLSAQRLTTA